MATPARQDATEALLSAAEELLVTIGYAAVTTRKLAEQAGVNHGLVHYYFGSMEEVFMQTLERFTDRLIDRQRALYDAPVPFIDKWREAMSYLTADFESGYQKVWLELQAMAWNRPEMRVRVAGVHQRWIDVLRPAFLIGMDELGIDRDRFPVEAAVALAVTFNQGVFLEQLSGVDSGHATLLAVIDGWMSGMASKADIKGSDR